MQKHQELIRQLIQLPLDERAAVLVAVAGNVAKEAGNKLPPGPVAHCANLRNAAREVQRVLKIDYGRRQQ
jgi:hypothetical protein